jgi:3-hydroxybutyryl-CoA dehydrogenase
VIWILESGVAADGIDDAMVLGCSHPLGPLRLADLIGPGTVAARGLP